jgi:hypothetical protein
MALISVEGKNRWQTDVELSISPETFQVPLSAMGCIIAERKPTLCWGYCWATDLTVLRTAWGWSCPCRKALLITLHFGSVIYPQQCPYDRGIKCSCTVRCDI